MIGVRNFYSRIAGWGQKNTTDVKKWGTIKDWPKRNIDPIAWEALHKVDKALWPKIVHDLLWWKWPKEIESAKPKDWWSEDNKEFTHELSKKIKRQTKPIRIYIESKVGAKAINKYWFTKGSWGGWSDKEFEDWWNGTGCKVAIPLKSYFK